MKFYLFIILLATSTWAGWYASEEKIREGIERASAHPLTHSNGAVVEYKEKVIRGSAAVVNREWIVTAAHVLRGRFVADGVQDLPPFYSFSPNGIGGGESSQVVGNYVFPKQDLAFLELEAPLPPEWVAPIMPLDLHQSFLEERKRQGNLPVADKGTPAFFFGCGHKLSLEEVKGKQRTYVHAFQTGEALEDLWRLSKDFGVKALGKCHLSQHFVPYPDQGSCFCSWIDTQTSSGSSALPGDSGGGLYVERDGKPYLTGTIQSTLADDAWDTTERRYLGTNFAALYSSKHEGGRESYLDTVLRVS